ncbi:hypothetical protein P4V72_05270 [Bacillus thuringiensis]|uniref:Uncharacterized protein n=1 Tax=Bacillus thuringiensis TaxID=1428 RepID=A0A9W3TLI5_BACTU|nr:hypothetical protein [Bacillus thuringiensis]AQY42451.1 hypothetical protein B4918_31605 [Bacillus thuringiensis]MDR4148586.1 hypothetical protein [Bacillus thuringiensis]MEC3569929.1 hypothetical protein [Bacillus thuringiensis]MED2022237.1 hypothetical protein [Bacillus thuringiensis]MED2140617.1 hypothetical protein [Bacillus thuringiensis]
METKETIVKFNIVNYGYGDLSHNKIEDYVFLFTTYIKKEDKVHGTTRIELIPNKEVLHFDHDKIEKIEYTGGNLKLNEFAEIVEYESQLGKTYVAELYKERLDIDRFCEGINHLLCRETRFSNEAAITLGREFENYIQIHQRRERLGELEKVEEELEALNKEKISEEKKENLQSALQLIQQKKEEQKQKLKEMRRLAY